MPINGHFREFLQNIYFLLQKYSARNKKPATKNAIPAFCDKSLLNKWKNTRIPNKK